jgi:hypothetical protein
MEISTAGINSATACAANRDAFLLQGCLRRRLSSPAGCDEVEADGADVRVSCGRDGCGRCVLLSAGS